MKNSTLIVGAALLYWVHRRQLAARVSVYTPMDWYEYAPVNGTDFGGDMWQRLSSGDIFTNGYHGVPDGNPLIAAAPTGYYVDPTNPGGSTLSTNNETPFAAQVIPGAVGAARNWWGN